MTMQFRKDFCAHIHIFSTSSPQWNWPNVVTPLLGHPARQLVNKPTPTKCDQSEASELNQAKARQPPDNNHNNLHIHDPNQIPNQILCLCHHRKAARHRCCWLPKQLKAKLFITISAREAKKERKKK